MQRPRKQGDLRRRVLITMCLAAGLLTLVLALVLTGSGTSAAHRCTTQPDIALHAVPAGNEPSTTLPPSHDNDTGGAHIHDHTPDADIDAYQHAHHCPS